MDQLPNLHDPYTDDPRQVYPEPMTHRIQHVRSRRRIPGWVWPIVAAVLVIGIIVAIALWADREQPGTTALGAPIVPVTQAPAPPATIPNAASNTPGGDIPENAIAGNGTYVVGTDTPAGKYTTAGPTDEVCNWARMRQNYSEPADAIIASGAVTGPTTVSVKARERFVVNGCKPWHRVS